MAKYSLKVAISKKSEKNNKKTLDKSEIPWYNYFRRQGQDDKQNQIKQCDVGV